MSPPGLLSQTTPWLIRGSKILLPNQPHKKQISVIIILWIININVLGKRVIKAERMLKQYLNNSIKSTIQRDGVLVYKSSFPVQEECLEICNWLDQHKIVD
jgi:hypothetical protein